MPSEEQADHQGDTSYPVDRCLGGVEQGVVDKVRADVIVGNQPAAVFLDHGYDGATMEEIARVADITKRTLYARYPDKRAVFLDVIPWALSRAVEQDKEHQVVIKTAADRLAALEARLRELHPYELPELLILDVENGGAKYLAWVRESVGL